MRLSIFSIVSVLCSTLASLTLLAACPGGGAATGPGGPGGPGPGGSGAAPAKPDAAAGLAAFETVRSVFQHPRCQNCHPAGDVPLQGDEGRPHNQNVRRGPTGHGMVGAECSTCHGPANPPSSYGGHMPPGNMKTWHMPPPEQKLVFVGASPRTLCEQVKDPARNGGMDMAALRKHLDDPLVVWGWSPGFGRAPIPVPRDAFLNAWDTWASAGTPCPDR